MFTKPWMTQLNPDLLVRYWRHSGCPGDLVYKTKGVILRRIATPYGEFVLLESLSVTYHGLIHNTVGFPTEVMLRRLRETKNKEDKDMAETICKRSGCRNEVAGDRLDARYYCSLCCRDVDFYRQDAQACYDELIRLKALQPSMPTAWLDSFVVMPNLNHAYTFNDCFECPAVAESVLRRLWENNSKEETP